MIWKSISVLFLEISVCISKSTTGSHDGIITATHSATYPLTIFHAIEGLIEANISSAISQQFAFAEEEKDAIVIDIIGASRNDALVANWDLLLNTLKFNGNPYNGALILNIYVTGETSKELCNSTNARIAITCFAGDYISNRAVESDMAVFFNANIRQANFIPTLVRVLDSEVITLITTAGEIDLCSSPGNTCSEVTQLLGLLGARMILPIQQNKFPNAWTLTNGIVIGANAHFGVAKGRLSNFAQSNLSASNYACSLMIEDIAENKYKQSDYKFSSWLKDKIKEIRHNPVLLDCIPIENLLSQMKEQYRKTINSN